MLEIQTLDVTVLMDMLSEQTTIYTRLLAEHKRTPEFEKAKKIMKQLQAEIGRRKTITPELIVTRKNNI